MSPSHLVLSVALIGGSLTFDLIIVIFGLVFSTDCVVFVIKFKTGRSLIIDSGDEVRHDSVSWS